MIRDFIFSLINDPEFMQNVGAIAFMFGLTYFAIWLCYFTCYLG